MKLTISGLVKQRARLKGELVTLDKQRDALQADLDAIDRALAICGYQGNVHNIGPKHTLKRIFAYKELSRLIQGIVRDVPDMPNREIAKRVIQAKGWDVQDTALVSDITRRVKDVMKVRR